MGVFMLESLTLYCEVPHFHGTFEPLNTITNIFYFVVAVWVYLQKDIPQNIKIYFTTTLTALFVGSFTYHFFRHEITLWMDIIPIVFTLLGIIYFEFSNFFKKILIPFVGFILSFIALFLALQQMNLFPNGHPEFYLTIIIFWMGLLLLFWHQKNFKKLKWYFLGLITFGIAFFFRQIDYSICSQIIFGTHFLWHICNALMLFFLLRSFKQ